MSGLTNQRSCIVDAQHKDEPWPVARYRLTAKAEMPPRPGAVRALLGVGDEVLWDGPPGWHMEPLDTPAKAAVARAVAMNGGNPLIGDPVDVLPA